MRLAWLLVLLPLSAHADLYRWIDPANGSVKYSSVPPSDPGITPEILRYNAPPPPKAAAVPPKPATTAPAAPANVAELENRWRTLVSQITAIPLEELKAGSDRVRQQMQAYEAVRAELDRIDPGGAQRRNAEMAAMMQRSLKAQ
jgi:hypothetical protein